MASELRTTVDRRPQVRDIIAALIPPLAVFLHCWGLFADDQASLNESGAPLWAAFGTAFSAWGPFVGLVGHLPAGHSMMVSLAGIVIWLAFLACVMWLPRRKDWKTYGLASAAWFGTGLVLIDAYDVGHWL